MNVVFACVPQAGHLMPLMPLAEAFAAQGDDVTIASGPFAETTAERSGLRFRRTCPDLGEWFEVLRARTRGVPGDGLAPERIAYYFPPRLFGEIATASMLDGLLDLCREMQPDLLVHEPYTFAAPLVGAVTSTTTVHHTIGPLLEPPVMDLVADAVSPMWRELGLDVPTAAGVYGSTNLTICPPSLDPGMSELPRSVPMRPAPLPLADPLPLPQQLRDGLADADRPLVYVTLGTFSNNAIDVFRTVLDALSDAPVAVTVTVGHDNDPASLDPVPANATVLRYVPQADLLPHCSAVIHHGGAGTMFGVLAHGLPSLVLPQSADNFTNAELLAAAGSGRLLMPGDVTAAAVRSELLLVLDDPTVRVAARRSAEEIDAMPSAQEVAARLRN